MVPGQYLTLAWFPHDRWRVLSHADGDGRYVMRYEGSICHGCSQPFTPHYPGSGLDGEEVMLSSHNWILAEDDFELWVRETREEHSSGEQGRVL